jgi:3',5'-cyclic AMP phosphodiesterase CpdA
VRTIAHISDLHFGAEDAELVEALRQQVLDLNPTLVAVSGDLTQRARRSQFAAAGTFLRSLPYPRVVVPGNHDIPLYNVLARFVTPRSGFRRHVTTERLPVVADNELAVIGADTTRSFTIKDGGLRPADLRRIVLFLRGLARDVVKVLVCHHPFDPIQTRLGRLTAPPPDPAAVATLIEHGADIFLTGHLHLSYTGQTTVRYRVDGRTAIVVEAGTASSTRVRGELNAFNVLRTDTECVAVERRAWDRSRGTFVPVHTERFVRAARGWRPSS